MHRVRPLLAPLLHRTSSPTAHQRVIRNTPRHLHTSRPSSFPTTTTLPSQASSCPSCGTPLPLATALCPSCSSLLPPPAPSVKPTYFALLALPPPHSFTVDSRLLKASFLKLQQQVHPDLFGGQGEKEAWAREWSGRVNEAYKALGDDLARAEYLLELEGVEVAETDSVDDPMLLMEIMETREALDDATTEEDVAAIRASNQKRIDDTLAELAEAFEQGKEGLGKAKTLTVQLRYFKNIDGVCREWSPGSRGDVVH